MARRHKTRRTAEFGDFQTPEPLARQVCALLTRTGRKPASVVEPTCGEGSFLLAALEHYPGVQQAIGLDINEQYIERLRSELRRRDQRAKPRLLRQNFFRTDWERMLGPLPEPILIVGNPPWITNAQLGVFGSSNLPQKSNFQKRSGFDAITGKSNFDISEWILIRLLEALNDRRATMAMLCKTAVARKVLLHAWKSRVSLGSSAIRLIDAKKHFAVAADACLLTCHLARSRRSVDAAVFDHLNDTRPSRVLGFRQGQLVADVNAYQRSKHLQGRGPYRWRSGIKHDCTKVMEFVREGNRYRNGLGELVSLEDEHVYPMLKSSDLANGRLESPKRWMLVTQRCMGDSTSKIESGAPKTWRYLLEHAEMLDARASSIYRKRPRFAVFGVGDYSFTPWKVAISGLYKRLVFAKVGSLLGKPIVLDDTGNFLACKTEREADNITTLLNSDIAADFFSAFVFWDAKRPITVELLNRLDIVSLAKQMGKQRDLRFRERQNTLLSQ